jgi:RimJ/RimL family protein N-acetyltransferase
MNNNTQQQVILRDLSEDDVVKFATYANNEDIRINMRDAFPNPFTPQDAMRYLLKVQEQQPKTFFAISCKGEYVGNISLTPGIDVYRLGAELAYFVGAKFQNQGIATEAVNLMTHYGFEHLGLLRIHAGIFSFNKASQRVLEKCGFTKEGVFKNGIIKNNHVYDEIRYAKLKGEEVKLKD